MSWPQKYRKSMCAELIEMMRNGDSLEEVAATFGCSRNTLDKWASDPRKPEFREALQLGRTLSEAWWMRLGRKGMMGEIKGWNAVSWIFTMKCRFHWKETQVVETLENIKMLTQDEIDQRVAEYKTALLSDETPSLITLAPSSINEIQSQEQ